MQDSEDDVQSIKIPAKRIAALRGEADSMLYHLERSLNVKLYIDREGEVQISGSSVDVFFSLPVIKAIGRGFDPFIALKLKNENYGFNLINLKDYSKKRNQIKRIKARIIGKGGKAKRIIEQQAECDIAVFGHTIGIIANLETLDVATKAIFKIIEGTPHSGVYMFLEKNKRKRREENLKDSIKMS